MDLLIVCVPQLLLLLLVLLLLLHLLLPLHHEGSLVISKAYR